MSYIVLFSDFFDPQEMMSNKLLLYINACNQMFMLSKHSNFLLVVNETSLTSLKEITSALNADRVIRHALYEVKIAVFFCHSCYEKDYVPHL